MHVLTLAALCLASAALGYVLCGLLHRAAWDAERQQHYDWIQARLDTLADQWARYYTTVRGESPTRPRITHVAEMDEPIRRHHG